MAGALMAPRRLTFDAVVKLALELPGVKEGTSYGTRAIKVRSKLLGRLKEDGETMALHASFVVRDHLIATQPDVFFLTDHYRDYPWVLVRLAVADRSVIRQLMEDAWRAAAPKLLIRELEERAE